MRIWLFSLVLLIINNSGAQGQQVVPYDIPFFNKGKRVVNPFVGGLRAGQFSNIDLDNDGVKDLVVFDRNSSIVSCFLQKGRVGEIDLVYSPEYASIFPTTDAFLILHDFNDDGIEDVFKSSEGNESFSTEVWRGHRDDNGLYFTPMDFHHNGERKPFLGYVDSGNSYRNIYTSFPDVSSYVDVDSDGDTDVLSFDVDGSFLNYYRNFGVELGHGVDTFIMRLEDICFGGFKESGMSSDIFLNPVDNGCAPGFGHPSQGGGPRHSGSTVLAFDGDCDGDMDLLIGDLLSNHLSYLENGGSAINPFMTSVTTNYPDANSRAIIRNLPSAWLVDVNNDGRKDLVATTNEEIGGNNMNHVWLYLDKSTTCAPSFELEQKDFLIRDMVHLCRSSHPQFCDFNADGLLDILVGTSSCSDDTALYKSIVLFENVGTSTNPVFNLIDKDYLNFSQASDNLERIALDIADIDGDGDDDLFMGSSDGYILYWNNKGGPSKPYKFDASQKLGEVYPGTNSSPDFIDMDGDGDLDLASGKFSNAFTYFENKGTPQQYDFGDSPDINFYGNVFKFNDIKTKSASPSFIRSMDDIQLVIGFSSGEVHYYDNITTDPTDTFNLITNGLLGRYIGLNATPDLADINGDNKYEIIVGNERGGLHLFTTDIRLERSVDVADMEVEARLYPNPVRDQLVIHTEGERVTLMDIKGVILQEANLVSQSIILNMGSYTSGLYLLKVYDGHKSKTYKVVKL